MTRLLQRLAALSIILATGGVGTLFAADATMTDNMTEKEDPSDKGSYLGTPWVSGGVGESSRDQLMREYDDYNLKLEFAVAEGNYLADVAVNITRENGTPVLRAFSTGPWLMTKLPAGTYDVTVNGFEKTFEQQVTVPAQGMETVVFNDWTKAGVAAATPGPSY
jgi:hypothetical protein